MRKRTLSIVLAAAMCASLTACGGGGSTAETTAAAADTTAGQAESTASTDTLRVILNSEPSNLDPHNNTRLTAWAVQEEVFDKLVTKDDDGNIVPDLATILFEITQTGTHVG